jgi:hypothetical protein
MGWLLAPETKKERNFYGTNFGSLSELRTAGQRLSKVRTAWRKRE